METILAATAIILLSGIASLALHRSPATASSVGAAGIVLGCLVGLIPAVHALLTGDVDLLRWAWQVPGGSFGVGVDALSAVFLLIIFVVSVPVCLFGASYLWQHREGHNLGSIWFFTAALIASMIIVVVARNAVLFLVAWELMSISSFFLVIFESDKRSVRRAGLIYLIAAHIGAAFLLVFFLLLGRQSGSLDFESFAATPALAGVLFIIALIGFGSKAGFLPFHVWLPEAHPAAPSHISALMSGVMIKMGIYGLFRALTLLGPPAYWWGILLIGIGLVSGLIGVLFALSQSNLKRLLAYSSVENVGIMAIGMGVGVLGWSTHSTVLTTLGFGGALLHVINHALFKGGLFLVAGSILQRCGTLDCDQLGGLFKRMPRTSIAALIATISIAGLPLGNGFISEFLVYMGAFNGASSARTDLAAISIAVVIGLALIGGLSAICFCKFFGIGFLGQPRSSAAEGAAESGLLMTFPIWLLAGMCVLIGLSAFAVPLLIGPALASLTGMSIHSITESFQLSWGFLKGLSLTLAVLLFAIAVVAIVRSLLLQSRSIRTTVTWDCGYAAPTARMQYRGYSFVQTVSRLFSRLSPVHVNSTLPTGPFPHRSVAAVKIPDAFLSRVYEPLFRGVAWTLGQLRWLQHGNVHLYILYILISLLTLMFWKLR